MPFPAFIAENAAPQHRARLWFSVRSGGLLALGFGLLAAAANLTGLIPLTPWIYALVAAKLVTNAASALSLQRDRWVMELAGLNVTMDLVVMTGAIYLTGGALSPLTSVYLIEITVVALLSNLGTTLLVAGGAFIAYVGMISLTQAGVIRQWPPPVAWSTGITWAYVVIAAVYFATMLGLPTLFTTRILSTLRDRERALSAQAEELVEAARQRSQFMVNVTHELRTPLQGILGLTEVMQEGIYGSVSDEQRRALGEVRGEARSLLALIDDLLDLARSDAGKLPLRREQVDLEEVLKGVVATGQRLAGTRRLAIELVVQAPLPPLESDRKRVTQVALNLLANAVKFTPDDGRITLRADRDGPWLRFRVADTGIGIPEQELARVFDEFRQVDGSASRRYGGVGLGLALVKRLCTTLGGSVGVQSAVGSGSEFTVRLPLKSPEPAADG